MIEINVAAGLRCRLLRNLTQIKICEGTASILWLLGRSVMVQLESGDAVRAAHHQIGNSLQSVASLLSLQGREAGQPAGALLMTPVVASG